MRPRYLVSRLSALGDVVCTLPVASCLKRAIPEAEIVWVVDPRFAGIVECCSAVDTIVRAKPAFTPSSWPRIEGQFEVALDMQGLFKSGIIVARASAQRKLGYHWQREASWLFSQRVLPDSSSLHVVDQYVDVARAAGGDANVAEFALAPKDRDLKSVKDMLKGMGVNERFVVMNPGAGWVTKRWPPKHFATLIDLLHATGVRAVLIGGKAQSDTDAVNEVVVLCKESPGNLVGNTSVSELVALVSMAAAHVGGDTGSTHVAAALGVPAVGLYSITMPARSCPYGQIQRCHFDAGSLAAIQPAAVFETLKEALA